jgi:5-methylcytosine-specific restriction endonuclease McrA
MSLPAETIAEVRRRAGFACEFCGVSEIDSSGELTIDHFQPASKGGGDDIDNLIYCCARCNAYKQAYWPESSSALPLWNPREQLNIQLDELMQMQRRLLQEQNELLRLFLR